MHEVYANAYFTLCAVSVDAASAGLFQARDALETSGRTLSTCLWSDLFPQCVMQRSGRRLDLVEPRGHLARGGLVVQNCLLDSTEGVLELLEVLCGRGRLIKSGT